MLLRIILSTHNPKMNYLALPRLLKFKIKNVSCKEKKDETKHGDFCKNWLCQSFSCCPKNLSCPSLFQLNFLSLRRSAICTITKCRQILNTPPHDKFESNMPRLKSFILFWNGSNDMNTEIEPRTNEHPTIDRIELSFSIFLI